MARKKTPTTVDDIKYLTQEEVAKWEMNSAIRNVHNRDLKILELGQIIKNQEAEMANLRSQLLGNELLEARRKASEQQKSHKKWVKEIADKYGMDAIGGYDPVTGELVGTQET
jgi:hypothetical protein